MGTILHPDEIWLDPPANPTRPVVETWDFTGGSDLTVLYTADGETSTINFDRTLIGEDYVAGMVPFRVPYQGPVDWSGAVGGSAIVVHAQFDYYSFFGGTLSMGVDFVDERTWDGITSEEAGTFLATTRVDADSFEEAANAFSGISVPGLTDAYDTGNLVVVCWFGASSDASQFRISYLTIEVLPPVVDTDTAITVDFRFARARFTERL